MAYFVENEYGEDVMLVTHEFSSIFHDTIFTEGYLIEGKLGPDHPGSLGMKTHKDFSKKKQDIKDAKFRDVKQQSDRIDRIKENPIGKNNGRSKVEYERKGDAAKRKAYNSALDNKYRGDGKTRYIKGSDKDKKSRSKIKYCQRASISQFYTIRISNR